MVESTYAMRSVMGRLFNRLVTTGTGLGLSDTQCGFKAFRTPVARLLFHLVRIERFAFDVEVLVLAHRLGLAHHRGSRPMDPRPGSTVHPLHDSISMLTDVYSSRLGLLATPAVPGIVVADASGATDPGALAGRVGSVLAASTAGTPLPVLTDSRSVMVLLPLVDPAEAATVAGVLRAELEPLPVTRTTMTAEALAGLGPLAGRLDMPTDART